MAFGIGPRNMGGAMGMAGQQAGQKFMNQPSQTQNFGNMGGDARQTMGMQGMPPIGQQGTLAGMQAPMGAQQGIGPNDMQGLLRKFMMMQQSPMQSMQGGIMGQQNYSGAGPGLSGMGGNLFGQ